MWSKRILALLLCLVLLCALTPALGTEDAGEEAAETPVPGEGGERSGGEELAASALRLLSAAEPHTPFLRGYGDGTIRPDAYLTLGEACQIFYNLLRSRPADRAEVAGVEKSRWYYDAMSLLAAGGILDQARDGAVLPDAAISRGQFILMLTRFFPELEEGDCSYPDVPYGSPWRSAAGKATAQGWINGFEDGSFRPNEPLTRAQAAAVLNRVMGRHADEEKLEELVVIPLFTDLPGEHWAYFELLEAVVSHEPAYEGGREVWTGTEDPRLLYSPGPVLLDGETYWAGEEGFLLRDAQIGELYFGPDGRYTCGDAEADGYIHDILSGINAPEADRLTLLRAAFEYVRDGFSYLRRTESYEYGATGWEVTEALTMLTTGRGNCYCYAAVFALLARQLGYDAHAIAGGSNWTPRPHAWVEIEMDGVNYIFDTELEMAKKGQYNFWMITPAELPWPYWKDEETMLYGG